jgi:quinolinate synthase
VEDPEKRFIAACKLCPYMKLNSLAKVRDALRSPLPSQIIELEPALRLRAKQSLDRMFELSSTS